MGKSKVASRKKTSSKRQKVYKMKGCSKKTCKKYLGGTILGADINLAYPTGPLRGGCDCGNSSMSGGTCSSCAPQMTGGSCPSCANQMSGGSCPSCAANQMTGGSCPSCASPLMSGESCSSCAANQMTGGTCPSCAANQMGGGHNKKCNHGSSCLSGFMIKGKIHRLCCKCSSCKSKRGNMKGGTGALVGKPWTPAIGGLPGVDGIQGDRNYLALNDYKPDISREMISTGANPPFSIGGGKGRTRKQRGGNLTNFLGQDLINLGRQFQFGVGSAYNTLTGHSSSANPLPWKDQFSNTPSLSSMKAASI